MNNFNVNASNGANRKKKSMVLVGILAIVLLITGTFAWRDYNQHKTNRLQGIQEKYDVSLNDSFNPNDYLNWQPEETADKTVNVSNEGQGDVYVRLRLSEFAGVGNASYINSEHRYLVNEKGKFIATKNMSGGATISDIELTALWNRYIDLSTGLKPENQTIKSKDDLASREIDSIKDMYTGQSYWYIQTDHTNSNGIYGKHVPIGLKTNEIESIVENKVTPRESDLDDGHHEGFEEFVCEDSYTVHDLRDGDRDEGSLKIREFFAIQKKNDDGDAKDLGTATDDAEVVLLSEISDFDNLDPKWIIDDSEEGGNWIYWSVPLEANETTANIMDQLYYKKSILDADNGGYEGEAFEYYVHIDMQALSKNELIIDEKTTWKEMSEDLLSSWVD